MPPRRAFRAWRGKNADPRVPRIGDVSLERRASRHAFDGRGLVTSTRSAHESMPVGAGLDRLSRRGHHRHRARMRARPGRVLPMPTAFNQTVAGTS